MKQNGASLALCGSYLETIEQQNIDLRARVAELESALSRSGKSKRLPLTPMRPGYQNALARALLAPVIERVQLTSSVVVDGESWQISFPAGFVQLSPTEWLLLNKLIQDRGRMVSRPTLMGLIEDNTKNTCHLLNIRMSRLRTKMGLAGVAHLITTIPARGFRLEAAS